jgi:putative NADH-flavin reductase
MKIFVLGPTGRTGQQIVAQALEAGHEVTAFARSPSR